LIRDDGKDLVCVLRGCTFRVYGGYTLGVYRLSWRKLFKSLSFWKKDLARLYPNNGIDTSHPKKKKGFSFSVALPLIYESFILLLDELLYDPLFLSVIGLLCGDAEP